MTARFLDVRLLAVALASWAACALTLVWGGLIAVTALTTAVGIVAIMWRASRWYRTGKDAAFLVGACVLAVILMSAVTVMHVGLRNTGLLADLAPTRAVVRLTGVASSMPRLIPSDFGERHRVDLKVAKATGHGHVGVVHGTARLYFSTQPEIVPGDKIDVRVRLSPSQGTDPAVASGTVLSEVRLIEPASGIRRLSANLTNGLTDEMSGRPPHAQGLIPGIAVGDDSRLPPEMVEDMRTTALTHLTAVSGQHISIIVALVIGLSGRRRRLLSAGLAAFALVFLIFLTGAEPSVLRAVLMGMVALAALVLRKTATALPALALAILLALAIDPWMSLSIGFALSSAATAGIVIGSPPLRQQLARWTGARGADLIAIPLIAQVACMPLLMILSPTASIWSVLANALVAPVVVPATLCSLGALIALPVFDPLGQVLLTVASWATAWIAGVAHFFARAPGSDWPSWLVFAMYILCAGLIARSSSRKNWSLPPVCLVAATAMAATTTVITWLLGVLVIQPATSKNGSWVLIQCDVGQGHASVVRLAEGRTILVDTGPPDGNVSRCLDKADIDHIDLIILTHHHADHVGALDEVAEHVTIDEVWLPPVSTPADDDAIQSALDQTGGEIRLHHATTSFDSQHWPIRVLWPDAGGVCPMTQRDSCLNDHSVVVRFHTSPSILIAGDLEQAGQERLADRYGDELRSDIVLVPHHGSSSQEPDFASAVDPVVSVVSAGENTYGHPAKSALELWGSSATLLETDKEGDIYVGPPN